LIIYCFTSHSRIFHLYGDVTITGEGLQNLGLCSASGPLSREGSLSCHTCCDTGPWFFRSHPKVRPILSPFTTHKGMWRIYSYPDPHESPFYRLLRHTRGCGGPIRSQILTDTLPFEDFLTKGGSTDPRNPTSRSANVSVYMVAYGRPAPMSNSGYEPTT
jgi:hypothetical protein